MLFEDKVVYQIYPKSFMDANGDGIGDICGVISRLDYLKNLGVDYLWLSPICVSPQKDNGYDIADYCHVDPMFGTDDDYKELILEANKRGMKIMLDLVLNHTSDQHEWFKRALAGDEKYRDFYIWRDEPNEIKSFFSKPAWTYAPELGKYYFHLFDKTQPDLNWENPEVRAEIYSMVNYWIELGVEGFRLDVIDLIGKEPDNFITAKGPKFYQYLKELRDETFRDKILTVGECWMASLEDSHKMCGDNGLTQVFHFTAQCLTNGEDKWNQQPLDLDKVCDSIKMWHNDYHGSQTIVMNNHDLPRMVSLWMDDEKYHYQSATALATLFTLLRGTQYIYQGEEIGMVNDRKTDISLYNDVETINRYDEYKLENILSESEIMDRIMLISRDNARTPMQWNSEENAGFTTGKPWLNLNYRYKEINVENDLKRDDSIYNFYRDLIKFKKENYKERINVDIDQIENKDGIIEISKGELKIIVNMTDKYVSDYLINKTNVIFNNYPTVEGLMPYQAVVELEEK